MAIIKPARGKTPDYDFESDEISIPTHRLPSFRTLLSRYNKANSKKIRFTYQLSANKMRFIASKVITTSSSENPKD